MLTTSRIYTSFIFASSTLIPPFLLVWKCPDSYQSTCSTVASTYVGGRIFGWYGAVSSGVLVGKLLQDTVTELAEPAISGLIAGGMATGGASIGMIGGAALGAIDMGAQYYGLSSTPHATLFCFGISCGYGSISILPLSRQTDMAKVMLTTTGAVLSTAVSTGYATKFISRYVGAVLPPVKLWYQMLQTAEALGVDTNIMTKPLVILTPLAFMAGETEIEAGHDMQIVRGFYVNKGTNPHAYYQAFLMLGQSAAKTIMAWAAVYQVAGGYDAAKLFTPVINKFNEKLLSNKTILLAGEYNSNNISGRELVRTMRVDIADTYFDGYKLLLSGYSTAVDGTHGAATLLKFGWSGVWLGIAAVTGSNLLNFITEYVSKQASIYESDIKAISSTIDGLTEHTNSNSASYIQMNTHELVSPKLSELYDKLHHLQLQQNAWKALNRALGSIVPMWWNFYFVHAPIGFILPMMVNSVAMMTPALYMSLDLTSALSWPSKNAGEIAKCSNSMEWRVIKLKIMLDSLLSSQFNYGKMAYVDVKNDLATSPYLCLRNFTMHVGNATVTAKSVCTQGSIVAVSGKAGCGKTSFGKLVTRTAENSIKGYGRVEFHTSEGTMPNIKMITQHRYLPPEFNLFELITGQPIEADTSTAWRNSVVSNLEALGASELIADLDNIYRVNKLSGGQYQKMRLAELLVSNVKMAFLDEPFSNLDQSSIGLAQKRLKQVLSNTLLMIIDHGAECTDTFYDSRLRFEKVGSTEHSTHWIVVAELCANGTWIPVEHLENSQNDASSKILSDMCSVDQDRLPGCVSTNSEEEVL